MDTQRFRRNGGSSHPEARNTMSPRRLLVVEGDRLIQGWLCQVLRAESFSVSVAECLADALGRLVNEPAFAAIICSRFLPDGTSVDLLGELRAKGGVLACVPVLVISANWSRPSLGETRVGFVIGPYDSEQLLITLNRLIDPARAVQTQPEKPAPPAA